MSDLIRLAGRRLHTDLFDADIHDLTVQWLASQFGFNGPMRRFPPQSRTSGGISTVDPGCGNEDTRECGDNKAHPADTDNDFRISPQEASGYADFWLSLPPPETDAERRQYERLREEVLKVAALSRADSYYDSSVSPRRCGFSYATPLDAENSPSGLGVSTDGKRSQNREVSDDRIELGQVNETRCDCPRRDMPAVGTGRYHPLPGMRFPMIMRSSACNPEYVGEQVAAWLEELDEAYRLILAGWEVPAVPQPEPPVRAAAAAGRIDMLRTAIRDLLAAGETDFRLLRLPGGIAGEGRPGEAC